MRPKKSYFTRVQRLTCALSLLSLMMITNAMWFQDPPSSITKNQTSANGVDNAAAADDTTDNEVSCYSAINIRNG